MTAGFWSGKRVFVTGHTGFKGSWLSLMLGRLGARVYGYATAAPTKPALFDVAGVAACLDGHTEGDVRDAAALRAAMQAAEPDVVFHLAAQSLVRRSYREPAETFAVNVMGTVNLFEAARTVGSVRAIVNVTSDKCYANSESGRAFGEGDPLGGNDPYSSSKACAELVTGAYRSSYFAASGVAVATARAGNVIGGGDWASDRLVPDFLRALDAGATLEVRHPESVRPWQHVLEPLGGYLALAEALSSRGADFSGSWNFGPEPHDARPVAWLLDRLCAASAGARWARSEGNHPREAGLLMVDSSKARKALGWLPRWSLPEGLARTLEWHAAWRGGGDMRRFTEAQIESHHASAMVAA